MSVDRSLKCKNALSRHRNVLSRDERLAKLMDEGIWKEGESVFGLPKVAHRKLSTGKKEKKKEEAAEGAPAAAGAAGAAAPAAGAAAASAPKTAGGAAKAPAKK